MQNEKIIMRFHLIPVKIVIIKNERQQVLVKGRERESLYTYCGYVN